MAIINIENWQTKNDCKENMTSEESETGGNGGISDSYVAKAAAIIVANMKNDVRDSVSSSAWRERQRKTWAMATNKQSERRKCENNEKKNGAENGENV